MDLSPLTEPKQRGRPFRGHFDWLAGGLPVPAGSRWNVRERFMDCQTPGSIAGTPDAGHATGLAGLQSKLAYWTQSRHYPGVCDAIQDAAGIAVGLALENTQRKTTE